MPAVPIEEPMGTDGDEAIAVARWSAVGTRLPFTRQSHAHAVVDSGGNGHVDPHPRSDVTLTAAGVAGIGNHRAGSLTSGTTGLHAQDTGRLDNLAAAAATAAGSGLEPGMLPEPWHDSHRRLRGNSTVFVTPRAASSRSSVTSTRTSAPRRLADRAADLRKSRRTCLRRRCRRRPRRCPRLR